MSDTSNMTAILTAKALEHFEQEVVFTPPAKSRFSAFFESGSKSPSTESQGSSPSTSDSSSYTPPASPMSIFDRLLASSVSSPSSPSSSIWNPSSESDPIVLPSKRSSAGVFGNIGSAISAVIEDLRRRIFDTQTECAHVQWERDQLQAESRALRAELEVAKNEGAALAFDLDCIQEHNASLQARNDVVDRDQLRITFDTNSQREQFTKQQAINAQRAAAAQKGKAKQTQNNYALGLGARQNEKLEREIEQLKNKVAKLEGAKK